MSMSARRIMRGGAKATGPVQPPLFGARPTDIPAPIVGRPSGPGYQRYEDLYQTGDSVTRAMERCADNVIITFPEGKFEGVDFPSSQANASILIPKRCNGLIGSGKGTVGGSTGTIFTMVPNSGTYVAPTQGSSLPSLARVMMRIDAHRGGTFANFQVAGTEQILNGRKTPFHCFSDYTPAGRTTFQDMLATGWYGDNGAPPGETFGFTISSKNGAAYQGHRFVRLELDGRRTAGGPCFGQVGMTTANGVGGYAIDCYFHHLKDNGLVEYQMFDFTTYDLRVDQSLTPYDQVWGHRCMNHERTDGAVHFRPNLKQHVVDRGVHMTHSNDEWTASYAGVVRSVADGKMTVVDPTWSRVWSQQYLFIESWKPYSIGPYTVGSESMVTPPLVVQADGVTRLPYKWHHGGVGTLIT